MVLDEFPRQLARTRRFSLGVPRAVTISSDGGRVLFLRTSGGEDPVSRLWLLDLTRDHDSGDADADAASGERLLADPTESWNVGSGEVPEAERIRRERMRELAAGIVEYSADDDCRTVAFALDGQLWVLPVERASHGTDRGDGPDQATALPRPVPTAGPVTDPRIDPTGQRVAYVTDGALHVVELGTDVNRMLAAPEHADVSYGLAEHVAAESIYRYRGFWWAPDGRRLLAARVDNAPVLPWWIADPSSPERAPRAIRYPAAGIQEPTEEHLWRYDPEQGLQRISDQPGVHGGSANGGTVVRSSWTEAGATMTVTSLGAVSGRPIACLAAEPVLTPRITWLTVGARELRAALLLPSWYEPGTSLPVLMSPYGGPAAQMVLRMRSSSFCEDQWFAEHGFAVLVVDGRGTPGRGSAWVKTVDGDALSVPVEDQADALKAVAEQFPDLDLSRVGIRGWSFGGALAAMAVIRRPEVFHAAISGAAPHDQRLYDTYWRERSLGHPQENPEAYDRSSTVTYAGDLTRPLLLIHGIADDNVIVAHTLRMSSALLAAGRAHQVLPLSGATHTPTDENTVSQLLRHQLAFLTDALGIAAPISPAGRQGR